VSEGRVARERARQRAIDHATLQRGHDRADHVFECVAVGRRICARLESDQHLFQQVGSVIVRSHAVTQVKQAEIGIRRGAHDFANRLVQCGIDLRQWIAAHCCYRGWVVARVIEIV